MQSKTAFRVRLHGIARLRDDDGPWPETINRQAGTMQLGYCESSGNAPSPQGESDAFVASFHRT